MVAAALECFQEASAREVTKEPRPQNAKKIRAPSNLSLQTPRMPLGLAGRSQEQLGNEC